MCTCQYWSIPNYSCASRLVQPGTLAAVFMRAESGDMPFRCEPWIGQPVLPTAMVGLEKATSK